MKQSALFVARRLAPLARTVLAVAPVHLVIKKLSQNRLAPRIRDAIADQKDASERLIGWVQLSVILGFAVLFLLSPKTHETAAYMRPTGWAIGAYLIFTLVRLILSYRIRLPAWFLILSIIADMALLLGLIWSFHIDYAQPPAFSLKAPTLLYVFIFVAIRALRFDARYVVLAGLTAAAGWVTMILYATLVDPRPDVITRDYVDYLTSNKILLGGEFDKVISIIVVTVILAVAIVRARNVLVSAIEEHAAAEALSRFFSPEIADQITQAKEEIKAGEGQQRTAAILTTDIRSFTNLSASLPANQVIALLTEYQAHLVPVLQAHGGSIDKFLGDGILVTFGAAAPSSTYAADALNAAQAVCIVADAWAQERAAKGSVPLEIAVSITTGPVIFGAVGDESRLEYTVIGDPVNLAAKLDKHAKQEGARVLATLETFRRAERQGFEMAAGSYEIREGRTVSGVNDPVDLVILKSVL